MSGLSQSRFDGTVTAVKTILSSACCSLLLALTTGCTPDNDLTGAPIPNTLPDTRITAKPPNLLEAGFMVQFAWSGTDFDGRIVGYQWKMANVGSDGINVQDTLSVDPASGDILHPWHFTTAHDSIFFLSADMDPEYPLDPEDPRFQQYYTFFIRAIDHSGGIDPTPAYLSFNAHTLLPTIVVDRPPRTSNRIGGEYEAVPPTVVWGWTGIDPDSELGTPVAVRYLWKEALYETPYSPPYFNTYLRTWYEFTQKKDEVLSYADSAWSAWIPYEAESADRTITFANQRSVDDTVDQRQITYIFAVQARDIAGAVSIDRVYGQDVRNVYISSGMTPLLEVYEPYLGRMRATGTGYVAHYDLAPDIELTFSWSASAVVYAGSIAAYRYGWDVTDPDDEMDPNWAVEPGLTPDHLATPPRIYSSGTHSLTIQAWDTYDQLVRLTLVLNVIPTPDFGQMPLLLVDDVRDQDSEAWLASDGWTALDRDEYRDRFWEATLGGTGGVLGFFANRDVRDTENDPLSYRDAVQYKNVIWSTRYAIRNFIWNVFKPRLNGDSRHIWLVPYQKYVGNVFLVGSRCLNSFLEEWRWLLPLVFDQQDAIIACSDPYFPVKWPIVKLPDGSIVLLGTLRYPYQTMGISLLDQLRPHYNVWPHCGTSGIGDAARNPACVGLKGLLVDPAFKAAHGTGADFPDTIFTDPHIDWRDLSTDYRDNLMPYTWGQDEFYDGNIARRNFTWTPQSCEGQPCVEPMFRVYSRFDWIHDLHIAEGDHAWPALYFDDEALRDQCGEYALDDMLGRTRTTGQITGFISHKTATSTPGGRRAVVWGFDPYRFEHDKIGAAIHWVLGEHFGLAMRP
jgi:hypothetical protein